MAAGQHRIGRVSTIQRWIAVYAACWLAPLLGGIFTATRRGDWDLVVGYGVGSGMAVMCVAIVWHLGRAK